MDIGFHTGINLWLVRNVLCRIHALCVLRNVDGSLERNRGRQERPKYKNTEYARLSSLGIATIFRSYRSCSPEATEPIEPRGSMCVLALFYILSCLSMYICTIEVLGASGALSTLD